MNNYTVYCLTLKIDGRKYIGATSQKPRERWGYGKGYKTQGKLYSAIKEHGWHAFDKEILFENLTKEDAFEKEKEYIKRYDTTNPVKGFNQSTGGIGISGYKFTPEQKEHLSDVHKGVKLSEKHRASISKSLQKYWLTHTKTVPYSHIMRMVEARKGKPSYNYGRKLSEATKQKLRLANLGKKASEKTKQKMRNSAKKKRVALLDENGEIISVFISMREAERQTSCSSGRISECCNGKRKNYKNYIWKYYE